MCSKKSVTHSTQPGQFSRVVEIFRSDGTLIPFDDIPKQITYVALLNVGPLNSCLAVFTFLTCDGPPSSSPSSFSPSSINGICSIRYKNMYKGDPGGSFPNAVMIDLWFLGKKYYVKYFSSEEQQGSFQLCDMRCIEEAWQLSTHLCSLFEEASHRIYKVCEEREKFKEALQYLVSVSRGPEHPFLRYFKLVEDNYLGSMKFCALVNESRVEYPSTIPDTYLPYVNFFCSVSSDLFPLPLKSAEAVPYRILLERAEFFCSALPLPPLSVVDVKYTGVIIRYDLGGEINRYELNKELCKRGYKSRYANTSGTSVMLHMKSPLEFDKAMIRRKDESGTDKFTFNKGGTVSHNGCLPHLMKDNYQKLFGDIAQFRRQILLSAPATSATAVIPDTVPVASVTDTTSFPAILF